MKLFKFKAKKLAAAKPKAGKPKKGLNEAMEDAQRFFESTLAGLDGTPARALIERRGLTPETVRTFGLGFWKLDGDWVGHTGEAGGYRAALRIHPERGLGVAVLANGGAANVERVAERLGRLAR